MSENTLQKILVGIAPDKLLEGALDVIGTDRLYEEILRRFCEKDKIDLPALPDGSSMVALGLGSTCVAGNSSANINVQSFRDFIPDRLVIPTYCAEHFLVTDIKNGGNTIFFDSTGCAPAMFSNERVYNFKFAPEVARYLGYVRVSVTNQSLTARNFQGVIVGHTPPMGANALAAAKNCLETVAALMISGDTHG
jgi:hypothetical protein